MPDGASNHHCADLALRNIVAPLLFLPALRPRTQSSENPRDEIPRKIFFKNYAIKSTGEAVSRKL